MHRRDFVQSGLAAGVAATTGFGAPATAAADRRHFELRTYELRSDLNAGRTRNFFRDALLPALGRAGAGAVGLFTPETGLQQSVVALIEYPSVAAVATVGEKLEADSAFMTAQKAFDVVDELPFVRYESQLMRAFAGTPTVEVPPGPPTRPGRLFELRTYEARNATALERKIAMFNEGETALFRSIGMTPVFFGENIFGTRLPSLTYMITFEDMAARQKAWNVFRTHPDWRRLSADEKYRATGSVTVTNVSYLNPLPFSPVR
jgi:hypothetical protein